MSIDHVDWKPCLIVADYRLETGILLEAGTVFDLYTGQVNADQGMLYIGDGDNERNFFVPKSHFVYTPEFLPKPSEMIRHYNLLVDARLRVVEITPEHPFAFPVVVMSDGSDYFQVKCRNHPSFSPQIDENYIISGTVVRYFADQYYIVPSKDLGIRDASGIPIPTE